MIDTSGTRYELREWAKDVWVLDGWQSFLKDNNLLQLEHFLKLSGEVVDLNTRSVVHRIHIGDKGCFYLKIHKNYLRRDLTTGFKKVPVVQIELENMMHYARFGLDSLTPVAWGWRSTDEGGNGFLLLEELAGYCSLKDWLTKTEGSDWDTRKKLTEAVADMVAIMHGNGLFHKDLFSWHLFFKSEGGSFAVQPIDLERTELKGKWPWSEWLFHRQQIRDLATLNLTVAWPLVSSTERLRFFLRYRGHIRLSRADKGFIRKVLKTSKRMGKRKKFRSYGVVGRLRS